ncbi:hypothetical protein EGW08_013217 [Elysia chlorotica]|uniref:Uncharacterized protein n=1 Tax=Elysia chlorotica TaxID=188477 RepID=A0A433TBS8_ELYCH|nr:hypothetical protein EGW08_013217 [Elysia chlorotica]
MLTKVSTLLRRFTCDSLEHSTKSSPERRFVTLLASPTIPFSDLLIAKTLSFATFLSASLIIWKGDQLCLAVEPKGVVTPRHCQRKKWAWLHQDIVKERRGRGYTKTLSGKEIGVVITRHCQGKKRAWLHQDIVRERRGRGYIKTLSGKKRAWLHRDIVREEEGVVTPGPFQGKKRAWLHQDIVRERKVYGACVLTNVTYRKKRWGPNFRSLQQDSSTLSALNQSIFVVPSPLNKAVLFLRLTS